MITLFNLLTGAYILCYIGLWNNLTHLLGKGNISPPTAKMYMCYVCTVIYYRGGQWTICGQILPTACFYKLYWNIVTLPRLCIVYSWSSAKMSELSSCNRDVWLEKPKLVHTGPLQKKFAKKKKGCQIPFY